MGKKGTKRKTRWRALPLGEDDGGSGNEEEVFDEDQSTNSSAAGQTTNFKVHSPAFVLGDKSYRPPRRFPCDRFRSKEPLIKLESKTFDDEEYTKITTPRQDVLFKKGYFRRKRDSLVEEAVPNTAEMESEEPVMDQFIITNGFVDERGHYYVNGNSYEVYDPYSNTVTVVVGPPPYTNGVTQPVLAAVSCQPVPLQPVEWYPPSGEWPSQGSPWTPPYLPNPHGDHLSNSGQNCDANPTFNGHDGQNPSLYHQPAYVVPGFVYDEATTFNSNDQTNQNNTQHTLEALSSTNDEAGAKLKTSLNEKEEEENEPSETVNTPVESTFDETGVAETNHSKASLNFSANSALPEESSAGTVPIENVDGVTVDEAEVPRQESTEQPPSSSVQLRKVEKQSHSTQTSLMESQCLLSKPGHVRVKESHSTQTMPEETFPVQEPQKETRIKGNQAFSPVTPSSPGKAVTTPKPQETRSLAPNKEVMRSSPRHLEDESLNCSNHVKEDGNMKQESKPVENVEPTPSKTSYAKKLLNGLVNSSFKEEKAVNDSNLINCAKISTPIGHSDYSNAQAPVINNNVHSVSYVQRSLKKTNNGCKRPSNDKFIAVENKRNSSKTLNGSTRNGYERQRYDRNNGIKTNGKAGFNQVNNKEFRYNHRKAHFKTFDKKTEVINTEQEPSKRKLNSETTGDTLSRSQSEKSSTVSELSSPTELSSGQNTPPEKFILKKMEQKIDSDFEEKLKQNLTKTEANNESQKKEENEDLEEEEDEEEEDEVVTIEEKHKEEEEDENFEAEKEENASEDEETIQVPTSNEKKKKKKKKKNKLEAEEDEQKITKSRKKRKPGDKKSRKSKGENFHIDKSFLSTTGNSQDFLFKAWESMNNEKLEPLPNMDSILSFKNNEILKTLGIKERWKLPVGSDLLLPAFGQERRIFTFEDLFVPTPTKEFQSDLFTKTNITNMRAAKPEEFFASVVDHPPRFAPKRENGKKGSRKLSASEKRKAAKDSSKVQAVETPSETGIGEDSPTAQKTEVDDKKNAIAHEEAKFGIVDAVNTWLKEQGNSEKILLMNSFSESLENLTTEEAEDEEPDQKNELGNPIHASSAESDEGNVMKFNGVDACIRVASLSKDDGYLGTETDAKEKNSYTGLYRSSSWDAKLSEVQIKKHFKFLLEASSWDRRKMKDARLKKHFKFIKDSVSYCHDLLGDVRNGYEYAMEELCDPKQSISKYYTLSPTILNPFDRSNDMDCESEVFDALEYKFFRGEGERAHDATGNLSVTDSGVHSDTESSDEPSKAVLPDVQIPLPNKEVCCKMQ